jgi:hemolysin activation/secretion protein
MRKVPVIFFVFLLFLSLAPAAIGQQSQISSEAQPLVTAQTSQDQNTDTDLSESDGVLIKEIIIEGNTVVDTPTLQKIVAPYLNTALTIEDMAALTDLVTMAYQDAGYLLARAFLPEQEVKDGVLKITVAEGYIGQFSIEGQTHYHDRVIERYFKPQETHGVINESMLEKGLLMTNELPNLKTNIILKEGAQPGEVDVVLNT